MSSRFKRLTFVNAHSFPKYPNNNNQFVKIIHCFGRIWNQQTINENFGPLKLFEVSLIKNKNSVNFRKKILNYIKINSSEVKKKSQWPEYLNVFWTRWQDDIRNFLTTIFSTPRSKQTKISLQSDFNKVCYPIYCRSSPINPFFIDKIKCNKYCYWTVSLSKYIISSFLPKCVFDKLLEFVIHYSCANLLMSYSWTQFT